MGDKEYDNPFSAFIVLKRNKKMKRIIAKKMNEIQTNTFLSDKANNRISKNLSKSLKHGHLKKIIKMKDSGNFESIAK